MKRDMTAVVNRPASWRASTRVVTAGRHELPAWLRRLDAVNAGQALLLVAGILVVATLPLLGLDDDDWPAALAVDAVMGGVFALSLYLPWRRWPTTATLLFPLATLTGLGALGLGLDGLGMAYAGVFILAFAYLGLMHPPGTCWRVLPWALTCYLGMADSAALPMLIRMTIVAVVWVLLAELLSRLAEQNRTVTADLEAALAIDSLTGVGSRRALDEQLHGLARGDVIAVVDLDHFKAVNDERGHGAGDAVLRLFGEVLRTQVRRRDFVARFGGEEFVLLLRDTTSKDALESLERIRDAWRKIHPEITFSSGLACNDDDGWSDRLLRDADAALYRAKSAGRDRDVLAPQPQ